MSALREPYKVVVWGPGVMGQAAIREVLRLPETELVGVLAYSPAKDGVDVGTLIGQDRIGVSTTTDPAAIVALKPDVVLHTARDFGDFRSDDDVVMLLEAGINVISVLPYQYPQARGSDAAQRLTEAAHRGEATLHGSGIDPGFLYERLAPLMTGISNDIEYIRLEEYFNCANVGGEILRLFGFGTTEEAIRENPIAAMMAGNYLTMGMHYLADHLGVPIVRIEQHHRHGIAEVDEEIPGVYQVPAGTVGRVSFEWIGYTDDERPMFQIQVHWYLNRNLRPAAAISDSYWILEIEGLPSSRLGLEIKGSIRDDEEITERNPAPPAYLATIVPAIQAIPLVVRAKPGVHVASMPEIHWKPDMRIQNSRAEDAAAAAID
jgi:2,4-diaminopentanoate dehydrogenase